MQQIMYIIGSSIVFIFKLAFIVGVGLILIYVILNALTNARFFRNLPKFLKKCIFQSVDVTRVWGPNFLVFYIFGQLLVSLLKFLGMSV